MHRLAAIAIKLIARGAIAAPLAVSGHGSEFFQARLTVPRSGDAVIEIIADHGQNPMLDSEEAARKALPGCLRLCADGRSIPLSEMGKLSFDRRSDWPADAPISAATVDPSARHELLALTCRFEPDGGTVQFENPPGNLHDVLLWVRDERAADIGAKPGESTKWAMLLGGDKSPVIPVRQPASGFPVLASAAILLSLLGLVLLKSRSPSSSTALMRAPQ